MMMRAMLIALAAVLLGLTEGTPTPTKCEELTLLKVQNEWSKAYGNGMERARFIEAVFKRFIHLDPKAKAVLKPVGSDNLSSGKFQAFSLTVGAHLDNAITLLDQPEALRIVLRYLHMMHTKLHGTDKNVNMYLESLVYVVPARLGKNWDENAWRACFRIIGDGIKGKLH